MTVAGAPARKRGQVWWARVDKRRPVLLVSRDEAYEVRRRVIAAEVTTTLRDNPATVELSRQDGLPQRCIVNCDNLVSVNQADLVEYVSTLSPARMERVERALLFSLGLD